MVKIRLLDVLSVGVVTTVSVVSIAVALLAPTPLWAAEDNTSVAPVPNTAAQEQKQVRMQTREQKQPQYQYREMQEPQSRHKWQNGDGSGRRAGMSQSAGRSSGGGKPSGGKR